ncbi:YjjG family noncanonical pyrimidine nucleotidase [Vagococcus humatus]|uniref:Noncanonical pyrimidine nucleotidase, YjjG family n=1 Tax=Vagococcus humatus TaxID=1889241 RepID=A0A429Z941_9ENTE|nr:YjjG family noncanonical pyrimidine nucleotidase [Vagococcus humatus]RST90186.1 noncanonical pyrimidine nucleotidase, YjjG family [Vagococcus humatus]
MGYKKIIFDLDDTLLDFKATEKKALSDVLTTYGIPETPENVALYQEINNKYWRLLELGKLQPSQSISSRFDEYFDVLGVKATGEAADVIFRKRLAEGHQLMNHADTLLQLLKQKGYQLYAGTNGFGKIQRQRLDNSHLNHYFDDLFISDEIGFAKPDIRFFYTIFDRVNLHRKNEIIMVGDRLSSDILGASNAGIDSIFFHPYQQTSFERIQPTFTVHHLLEILPLMATSQKRAS